MTNSTTFQNHATVVQANWLNDVDRHVYDDVINIMNYGADNTGVALCNTALDLAKAAGRNGVGATVYFPPGVYRIENYSLDDLRIVGARASGSNVGANDCTVIEGSGDIFVNCTAFALEHLVIRNSSAGTRGKLLTIADEDTKIGPIIDVDFRKATYHIYAGNTSFAIVSGQLDNCRFSDATVYSRYYEHNLFAYDEYNCYTQSCKRGLYIRSCSTAHIHGAATVFEYCDEGAIYVENTAVATDVIRSLCFEGIHFEHNGNVTPTADVTVNVTLSLGRIKFDSCGFYLPTVAASAVVDLSSSPSLKISEANCTDIGFTGVASTTVITRLSPKIAGMTPGLHITGGLIYTDDLVAAGDGFTALSSVSVTITGTATPTPIAVPAAGQAKFVLVSDSTTEGAALLQVTPTVVAVVATSLTSITFDISGGFVRGRTTGGASSRTLYFNQFLT